MADFEITAEYSDLQTIVRLLDGEIPKSAQSSASVFDREFRRVEKTFSTSAKAAQDFYNTLLGVTQTQSDASKSASVFSSQMKNLDQDIKMAAEASEFYNNKLLGISQSHKSAKSSADVFKRALAEEERASEESVTALQRKEQIVESLKLKYNPLYAAMQLFEREQREMTLALNEGALSATRYQKELEKLTLEYNQFAAGTATSANRFAQSQAMSKRTVNDLGVVVQQTGYQFGDFLVQVQSGTNWMVAFGQQATQLVGVLPMLSSTIGVSTSSLIAISTGLGIAIPLITAIGAAWMRTRKGIDEAAKGIKELEGELKNIDQTLQDWVRTKKAAEAGVTVEELLGLGGIDKAEKDLQKAKADLDEFNKLLTNTNPGTVVGTVSLQLGDLAKSLFNADVTSKYEAALESFNAAEARLADLRRKQSSERLADFNKESLELKNQLAVQQGILRFGKDSAQVKALELEQEIVARQTAIDLQYDQTAEGRKYAEVLKAQTEELLRSEAATEKFTDFSRETSELMNQLAIQREIARFGRDSAQVRAAELEQEIIARKTAIDLQYGQTAEGRLYAEILKAQTEELLRSEAATEWATIQTGKWAGVMSEVGAEINAIISGLNSIGGGMIANAAKSAEVTALKKGKTIRDAAVEAKRVHFEAEVAFESQGANWVDRQIIGIKRYQFEHGIALDAVLDKERELARDREKRSSSGGSKPKKAGGIGGTSGVGSDAFSFIKDILGTEDLATQMAELDVWHEEALLRFQTFNEKELSLLAEHNVNKMSIKEEYDRREAEIERVQQNSRLSATASFLGSMATVLQHGGEKANKVAAVLGAGEAFINTLVAQSQVLADPKLGFYKKMAAYAAIGASGFGLVASLKGAMSGGGSSGGSGGGGGSSRGAISTPTQETIKPQEVLIQGLESGMRLSPEELQEVFDQIYEENGRRGTIFKVALN